MPFTMQGQNTVAPNTRINNVLTGQKYERPPGDAEGSLYINGSATGLQAELNVNSVSVTDVVQVNSQNRIPVVPDDVLNAGWMAPEGKLIQLSFNNTTAGSLTAFWRVDLDPIFE